MSFAYLLVHVYLETLALLWRCGAVVAPPPFRTQGLGFKSANLGKWRCCVAYNFHATASGLQFVTVILTSKKTACCMLVSPLASNLSCLLPCNTRLMEEKISSKIIVLIWIVCYLLAIGRWRRSSLFQTRTLRRGWFLFTCSLWYAFALVGRG